MKAEVMAALEAVNKARAALEVARAHAAAAAECLVTNKINLEELAHYVGKMQAAEKAFNQAAREYRASYQPEAS